MTTGGAGTVGFAGRGRERDAIVDAMTDAARGQGGTVFIEAASGMGATRLLDESVATLTGEASPAAPIVVRTDGLPAWRGAPYAPLLGALGALLARRPTDEVGHLLGAGGELLLPALPEVAARLGATGRAPTTTERLTDRVHEAVRGLLGRLAEEAPVLAIVEDLHEIDAASRALVAFLARTLGERRVLLVGTYQPDALGRAHPLRATIDSIVAGPRPVRRIALGPLDQVALRDLIASHEGEAPSAPVLLLVADRSGGNPFVAGQLLAARRELSGASMAQPLEQLVVSRVALRSVECRRVLRMLAVADGPLRLDQLGLVAAHYDAQVGRPAPRSSDANHPGRGGALGDLRDGIDEAIAHGFVERLPGDPPRGRRAPGSSARAERPAVTSGRPVRIRHELLAGALAADLLPGSRRRMHAAVASALPAHPAEAGRHWHHAHEPPRELEAEQAAATEAETLGAAADALEHLERAIALGGAPAVGELHAATELDLHVRAADAAAVSGDPGRAVAFMELAIAQHRSPLDRAVLADLTRRLGSFRWAGGDRDGALAAYERALELLPERPSAERARVLALVAHVRMLEGSFSDAERLAADAIAAAPAADPEARRWLGHARCTQGAVDSWLGRPAAAIAHHRQALAIAVELGLLEDAFRARANLAAAHDIEGQRADAVAVSRQGIAAAEAAGLEVAHGNLLRGNAVDALISLGRWQEAREMAERALDWAPSGLPLVMATLGLAIVETEQRAGETAARLLGRLFLELETIPDTQFAAPAYQAAASLAAWRGDGAEAVRAAGVAWGRVRGTEQWVLAGRAAATALAAASLRARDLRETNDFPGLAALRGWADGVLAEATRMVEAAGAPPSSWVRREVDVDLAMARAHRDRLAGRETPAAWAAVAARWRELRRPYEAARALFHEAEAHLGAGQLAGLRREGRDDARHPIVAAARTALQLDALPLLRAIGDTAARARIPMPRSVVDRLAAAAAPPPEMPPPAPTRAPASVGAARQVGDGAARSFGLSPRERGVLAEIVEGRSNRAIGERLFISDKTVGVHVGNILAKLGVAGRVEAATIALRLGLVDDLLQSAAKPGPRVRASGRRRGGAA